MPKPPTPTPDQLEAARAWAAELLGSASGRTFVVVHYDPEGRGKGGGLKLEVAAAAARWAAHVGDAALARAAAKAVRDRPQPGLSYADTVADLTAVLAARSARGQFAYAEGPESEEGLFLTVWRDGP